MGETLRDRLMQRALTFQEWDPNIIGETENEKYIARRMARELELTGDVKAYYYTSGTRYRWVND